MHWLDDKVFDIADARFNHKVNLHKNCVPDWTVCFFLSFIKCRSERFVLIGIATFPVLLRMALSQ